MSDPESDAVPPMMVTGVDDRLTDPFFRAVVHSIAGEDAPLYGAIIGTIGSARSTLPGTIDAFTKLVNITTQLENIMGALVQHADEIRPTDAPTLAERLELLRASSSLVKPL